ncbi:hypothetical protein DMB42_16165 [Nonomuraea sp. WAC 01424]|uniref:helix-turn-helix transcriptional regulator n=1 Tax=Nonomuraea sp. WAC 01424 TaxID=2203200 RepID=UPI000F7B5214|nr:helix-turn-helix transcriptional regulator [Nonomuraea sp. WAC 01424]RSN10709.1 hypothetical protein DMB42_16165 [Nonomuraea sp. WAC 01424]
MPGGGRRRTPGLRRQEVAQLAGMSIDYYIRLEQGRGPHPSRQVLGALGRALMLDQDERAHLFRLAGQVLETPRIREDVPAGILHLLAFLEDVPAYVMDARYDLRAWNPLANLLTGDLDSLPPDQRNVIRWVFMSLALPPGLARPAATHSKLMRCERLPLTSSVGSSTCASCPIPPLRPAGR